MIETLHRVALQNGGENGSLLEIVQANWHGETLYTAVYYTNLIISTSPNR